MTGSAETKWATHSAPATHAQTPRSRTHLSFSTSPPAHRRCDPVPNPASPPLHPLHLHLLIHPYLDRLSPLFSPRRLLRNPSLFCGHRKKKVGLLGMVVVGFFWVHGGVYGNEAMLVAGPPRYVFFLLAVVPFVYSLPIALIVAELSTAFPEACGTPNLPPPAPSPPLTPTPRPPLTPPLTPCSPPTSPPTSPHLTRGCLLRSNSAR